MKQSTFNKLKNLLWPEKVIAAKIKLTNGATIDGQCVQITAYGGGGGGGRLALPPSDKSRAALGEKE